VGKVVSIDNKVVKLKELGLLNREVNSQSNIDEILKAIIHSYEEIKVKSKGKEVCPSSDALSGVVKSMVSPHDTEIGSTSYSEPKGEERKAKEDGKDSAISMDKAEKQIKGNAKGFVCTARVMDMG
jgi:hypothetical protein